MKRVRPYALLGGVAGLIRYVSDAVVRVAPITIAAVLPIVLAIATQAGAQHSDMASSAPPPPAGNGALTVQVLHPANPAETAGIAIALYALSTDGTPGFAGGETNAEGVFTFTGISTDPGIVYLVGARFLEIPFGERVTFAAGETEARVEIEVMAPTDRTTGVAIEELRIRIDWMGDRIVLREVLRISNAGERVIQLPDEDRSRSIVARRLGPSAHDFSSGSGSIGDGLALEEGRVRFRGPLYPGEQRVEYQYSLPIPAEGGALRVPVELAEAAARIVVVAGTAGVEIRGAKLVASSDFRSDSGQSLKSWARAGLAAGEVFEIDLTLPESRLDPTLLSVPRGDVWLELDDTRLTANVELQILVEPGAPVAGSPDAPLLQVSIPTGATLNGIAPEAESLGLIAKGDPSGRDAGFDVVGPIGAGTTSLGFSYSMPARPDGVELDMRFPAEVQTLNVLIADTALALDSSRLHRRRPFRSGTRNYLHREAFNIAADEIVDLSLVPLGATGLPQSASIALAIAAAAAGAIYLFAPLRTASRKMDVRDSPLDRIQAKREMIYAAIRDLDHDFETAKLEQHDYTQMREGLRAEAIELLRSERDLAALAVEQASPSSPTLVTPASEHQTGAYCPNCGDAVSASWRFCSHCGGDLNPAEEASG